MKQQSETVERSRFAIEEIKISRQEALAAMDRIRAEYSFENHVRRFGRMLQRLS